MRLALLLAAGLGIGALACTPSGGTESRTIRVKGSYLHENSGTRFPTKLGVLERGVIRQYGGRDGSLFVVYNAPEKADPVHLNLYLSPGGQAWAGRLRLQFVQRMAAMRRGRVPVELRGAKRVRAPGGTGRAFGYEATYASGSDEDAMRTLLRLYQCGQWFLRVHMTAQEKHRYLLPLVLDEVHGAFSCEEIADRNPAGDTPEPSIEPEVADWPEWVAYAEGQVEWLRRNVSPSTLALGIPDYDVDLFVSALNRALDVRRALVERGEAKPSALFDGLMRVREAGFLDEFLWTEQLGFLPEPEGLDLEGFRRWREQAPPLPAYQVRSGAVVGKSAPRAESR